MPKRIDEIVKIEKYTDTIASAEGGFNYASDIIGNKSIGLDEGKIKRIIDSCANSIIDVSDNPDEDYNQGIRMLQKKVAKALKQAESEIICEEK